MFDAGKTHVAGCACHWRSSAGGRRDSRASCSSSSARWSASMKHSEPLQRQREKKAWAKVQMLQNWEQKRSCGKAGLHGTVRSRRTHRRDFKAFSNTHKAALKQLTSTKRSAFSRIIALKWSGMHKILKMPVLASTRIQIVSDVLMWTNSWENKCMCISILDPRISS